MESGEESPLRISGGTTLTAVGIDRDKNSQQAVKWAVDHLLINSHSLILLHVRNKAPIFGFAMAEATPDATRQQLESDTVQLFMPYRGFCNRKGIKLTEVVLEDSDIPKAINEYIAMQQIHNFVVGASAKNTLGKYSIPGKYSIQMKFRHPDVASSIVKSAPDFCAVYVISKGKATTVRSAKGPVPVNASPRTHADHDDPLKTPFSRRGRRGAIPVPLQPDQMKSAPREKSPIAAKPELSHLHHESVDLSFRPPRQSQGSRDSMDDLDFQGGSAYQSDFSICQESSASIHGDYDDSSSSSSNSKLDMEAEMKRLKLELKQTMDMYSNAGAAAGDLRPEGSWSGRSNRRGRATPSEPPSAAAR